MNNDCIVEYINAFPHELCDELMSKWQSPKSDVMLDFHPTIPASIIEKVKTSRDLVINLQDPYLERLNLRYHETLQKSKDKYAKLLLEKNEDRISWSGGTNLFETTIIKSAQTHMVISRTDAGEMYNWHADAHRDRLLTCILYLNDMDEDAGGCTEFSNGRSVRPEKGKVLIFPATPQYIHRGAIVNRGSKYVITTFAVEPELEERSAVPFKLPFKIKPDH
jgi:hypothetical protein